MLSQSCGLILSPNLVNHAPPQTPAVEYRRYPLHRTPPHETSQNAGGNARISKRASAHTFRHSVVRHVLQAHDAIRTLQA
jgi:hypothetical protein